MIELKDVGLMLLLVVIIAACYYVFRNRNTQKKKKICKGDIFFLGDVEYKLVDVCGNGKYKCRNLKTGRYESFNRMYLIARNVDLFYDID